MNSNLFHNLLNAFLVRLAAVTAGRIATGCVQLPDGKLDCSASWISPAVAAWITGGIGLLKIVINVVRDGFGGLFKPQPPVKE